MTRGTWIVGFTLKQGFTNYDLLRIKNSLTLAVTINGEIEVYNGATLLGKTGGTAGATAPLADNQWHYVELKGVIDAVSGSWELRIDGAHSDSGSGVDTGSASDEIEFVLKTTNQYLDDIYIYDGEGTTNNDFLGTVFVEGLLPTADGNSSDWTPSSGTDNYALIDENPSDLDGTDSVSTTTADAKDRILSYINQNISDWLAKNGFNSMSEAAASGDEQLQKQLEGFLANYPSHFALTQRKQILQVLEEIAFQARCAITLKDNTFFLRYLPAEPVSVDTITESDIEVGSLELFHTTTEDLVTKLVARWRATGAQEEDNKVILRHNVRKYGTKEREFDFYIYNKVDMVIKSATYWLIRFSNTWKKVRFSTPITKLNLETFDAVTLDFDSPYVADSDVLAVIEKADYNSESHSIDFECWTLVKAGEMASYDFAYPADVDSELRFPTPVEVEEGFDGGTGIGHGATGAHPLRHDLRRGVRVSYDGNPDPFGFEAAGRANSDRGGHKPSDSGDLHPGQPLIGPAVVFDERLPGQKTPPSTTPASTRWPNRR